MVMGLSESGGQGCRKHQSVVKTSPSPGVCPFCLRERLSQLCASNNKETSLTLGDYYNYDNSFSSSPSAASSSIYDVNSLPSGLSRRQSQQKKQSHHHHHHHHHHHRNVSEVLGSISMMLSSGGSNGGGLKKSRSMALVAKAGDLGDHHEVKTSRKKGGFWSKLLGTSSSTTTSGKARSKDHDDRGFTTYSNYTVGGRLGRSSRWGFAAT